MKPLYFLFLILWFGSNQLFAADAIILENKRNFTIESIKNAKYTSTYKIIINNERGLKYAYTVLMYSPFISIRSFEATISEEGQEKVKKIKLNQLYDHSFSGANSSFYMDYRYKLFMPEITHYPAQIDFSVSITYQGFISLPQWDPVPGFNVQVNQSSYDIIYPATYGLKTKSFNLKQEPTHAIGPNKEQILHYELINWSALKEEPLTPSPIHLFPCVYFSPDQFYFDTYTGNTSTWIDFGKFVQQLLVTKQAPLSEQTKMDIHKLMENNPDKKILLEKLYSYFQNRTRYVSIQLGIGGFKPMEPSLVDQNGYGDCKGLSFYFKSILDEAKIPANYTLIYGGSEPIGPFDDFPYIGAFNHAVLMCYLNKDTLLIECTSQTDKLGAISSFTANRRALVIGDKSIQLVQTPSLAPNFSTCTTRLKLDSNHHATVSIKNQQIESYSFLAGLGNDEKTNILKQDFRFQKIMFNQIYLDDQNPNAIQVNGSIRNYASGIGDIWMMPILLNQMPIEFSSGKRELPFEIKDDHNGMDSIYIQLPTAFNAKELPEDVSISNKFGSYQCVTKVVSSNELLVYRKIEFKPEIYAANEFETYQEMLKKIGLAEKRKISIEVKN